MPVKISHNIELSPELPNEVRDIAREHGEDPERVCEYVQELRDLIYGKFIHSPLAIDNVIVSIFNKNEFILEQSVEFVHHYGPMMSS